MIPRLAAATLAGLVGAAVAQPSAAADPTARSTSPRGAIVLAGSAAASKAASALARAIYQEPSLRPAIADELARVLVGEAPREAASARVREVAELRAAAVDATSDVAARRLWASIGIELGARAVVVVTLEPVAPAPPPGSGADGADTGPHGAPVARVLRVDTVTYEGVRLTASVEPTPSPGPTAAATTTITWPGAVSALRGLLGSPAPQAPTSGVRPAPAPGPRAAAPGGSSALAALVPQTAEGSSSLFRSPWFWGGLGAVVTVAVTAVVVVKATEGEDLLRVQGRVPR